MFKSKLDAHLIVAVWNNSQRATLSLLLEMILLCHILVRKHIDFYEQILEIELTRRRVIDEHGMFAYLINMQVEDVETIGNEVILL